MAKAEELQVTAAAGATAGAAVGALVTACAALALAMNNATVPLVYAAGANAPTLVFLRYVFFLAVLIVLLTVLGKGMRLAGVQYLHAAGAGAIAAIGSMGLLGSFALIPLSLAILISYLYPILTAMMTSLIERRLPSLWQIACLIAAFVGLGIALEIQNVTLNPLGIGLAFLSAIGFGGSFVWNRYGLANTDSTVASFHMGLAGLLVTGLVLYLFVKFQAPRADDIQSWLLVGSISLGFTLAFLGMYSGVQRIGATAAAMIMNLEPILTIALSVVVLGESLSLARIIGGGIVLAAVIASQLQGWTPSGKGARHG